MIIIHHILNLYRYGKHFNNHQTVTGYMHNVTPLRHRVKHPYFEGLLQQCQKIPRFKPLRETGKQVWFFQMLYRCISTKNCCLKILSCFRSPVQVNNVALQPARKEGEKDILLTPQSKWSCSTSFDYPYNPTITATRQSPKFFKWTWNTRE